MTSQGADAGPAAPPLHPLLAGRWSPTTFDGEHELTEAEVDLLLEAALASHRVAERRPLDELVHPPVRAPTS